MRIFQTVFAFSFIALAPLFAGEITFNFETGDLRGWTAEGEAFKHQPTEGDNAKLRGRPANPEGKFWIGTYEDAPKGGTPGTMQTDKPTGKLTSDLFKLDKPWISFLIGGGNMMQKEYASIQLADGKEIFRATGFQNEAMKRVAFDATKFVGQDIRIQLVDTDTGHFGHINFDDFKQSGERPSNIPAPPPPDTRANGLSPADAVKAMTVPDGFTVKLVASEPEIHQPVAFCFDERGRMWLLESYDYPRGQPVGKKGKDRILILEDTTGSGKADKIKVFYEGLNLATGLEVGHGGVFVGQAPDLLFIPDRNRDDVPDGEPEVLLTGFGRNDTHELLNSFIWGPDGWLYGNHGVFVPSKVLDIKFTACVWRYHPTTKKFEIFAEGGSNQWGLDFDDYGSAFITACVIPHLFHMVPGGLYIRQGGQNANPYAYGAIDTIADHRHFLGNQWNDTDRRSSDSLGGGHAHDGACIYLGDSYPPEYRNTILMGNIHGNRINRDILVHNKSSYIGKHGPDFLLSNDKWFMPSGERMGPDGSVFISDWYDKQHCHSNNTEIWDRTNGRLYKVEYKGTKFPGAFDLAKLTTPELVAMQKDRNDWKVRQARRILTERKATDAIPALQEIALHGETQEICLRGLWALYCLGGFDPDFAHSALKSQHPFVRAWSVRFIGESRMIWPWSSGFTVMQAAANDKSPEVRSQVFSALLANEPNQIFESSYARLYSHDEDVSDANIPLLSWLVFERQFAGNETAGLNMLKSCPNSKLMTDYIAPRFARKLLATQKIENLALAIQFYDESKEPARRAAIMDGIQLGLKGRGKVTPPPNWPAVYASAQQRNDADELKKLKLIAAQFGDAASLADAMKNAANPKRPVAERVEALKLLASSKAPGAEKLCFDLIDGKNGEEIKREAIRGLGSFSSIDNAKGLIERWKSFDVAAKVDTLDVLCSRADFASALLDACAANSIARTEIGAAAVRRMRELKDDALNTKIETAWGRVRERAPDEIKAQIEKYRAVVKDGAGDAKMGAAIFEKTCMPCHAIFAKGNHVGPELTGSNRKDINYLLENIVDPNAVVGAPYNVWSIKKKDGIVLSGLIAEQDEKTVTLKSENDKREVIQREDISKMTDQKKSMMPEGLPDTLKPQEFRDLVKFLQGDGW
ncbi:MAG: PVC-type heme-binding CxxCH protein [Planctomycetota bacterium]